MTDKAHRCPGCGHLHTSAAAVAECTSAPEQHTIADLAATAVAAGASWVSTGPTGISVIFADRYDRDRWLEAHRHTHTQPRYLLTEHAALALDYSNDWKDRNGWGAHLGAYMPAYVGSRAKYARNSRPVAVSYPEVPRG